MKKRLNEPVLILNKNWIAIRIKNVKKAILLASRGKAYIVDPKDFSIYTWEKWINISCNYGEGISTTKKDIKIPSVILLTEYGKIPKISPRLTKKNIFIRDNYTCQYSGQKVSTKDADIDHVIPISRNGTNSWENMVVCSKMINRTKANKTPKEAGLELIKEPKKPSGLKLLIDPNITIPDEWNNFIR